MNKQKICNKNIYTYETKQTDESISNNSKKRNSINKTKTKKKKQKETDRTEVKKANS